MSKKDNLDNISEVVMAADNPTAALDDLTQTLPAKHHGTIAILREMLAGKTPDEKALKKHDSLWTVLFRLVKVSDKPPANYLAHYQQLSNARLQLESTFKTRFFTYLYFFWLVWTMIVSLLITVKKTLPTYERFYADFGAELPPLTQFILDGNFLLVATVVFLLIVIVAMVVPWLYRRRIKQLLPIPGYLRWFPFYFFLTRHYHRYLHSVFTGIYYQAGVDNPIQRGGKILPKMPTETLQQQLLPVAIRQGSFTAVQQRQQQQLADATLKHIRVADSLIGGIILIIYAFLVYYYIMGVYLPLFQLGEVVG